MSTTTTQPTSIGFDWSKALPLFEFGANIALGLLGANGIVPGNSALLAQGIEGAVNPLLSQLTSGQAQPVTNDVLAGYATLIGVLNTLKADTSLPADVLSKINDYIIQAQNATAAAVLASKGFDPTKYGPVQPIS